MCGRDSTGRSPRSKHRAKSPTVTAKMPPLATLSIFITGPGLRGGVASDKNILACPGTDQGSDAGNGGGECRGGGHWVGGWEETHAA